MSDSFWDTFYAQPLDKIPWQNTQADWFKKLVDDGTIRGASALDLGCGTGKKSIYLAQHGFENVAGVDIAPRAIEMAKENAEKEKVSDKCKFLVHDIADWSFMGDGEKFDFILDWAALHGLPPDQRIGYARNVEKHAHQGSLFLIRSFGTDGGEKYFEEEVDGVMSTIYLLSDHEIQGLFSGFETIRQNKSLPRTKPDFFFVEMLMRKK